MKKNVVLSMLTMAMVVLFASCAKVPQAEIDAANVAIDSAKVAEAAVYVPEQLAQVEDSLKSALAEVETQKSKWYGKKYWIHIISTAGVESLPWHFSSKEFAISEAQNLKLKNK